jgi:ABC-type sugar transport system ATPase subunit
VLKGINLEARTGEFIALVGPSGCGKSTLLAMIAGLETVTEGEIRIDGTLVNSVAPKDCDIAMVFQSYALYPTMTARQNMTFGMEGRGVPKVEQDAAIKRVASLLQIEPLLNRKPGQIEAMTLASRIAVMHLGSIQQFDYARRRANGDVAASEYPRNRARKWHGSAGRAAGALVSL